MIAQTIEYTDFNGDTRSETHYFNYTKPQLLEWEASVDGGMKALLQAIIKADDKKQILEMFKTFVLGAYGIKSADGRKHEKSDALREEFASTAVYAELYMKLAEDADYAAAFVNGCIPAGMAAEITEQIKKES